VHKIPNLVKEALQPAVRPPVASIRRNYSVNPFQLLQNKNIVGNPFQQLKKEEALQPVFNPIQLLANSRSRYMPVPLVANSPIAGSMPAQLTKLPNIERGGPEFYIKGLYTKPVFAQNHRVDPLSDFTTAEAKKRGLARTSERKNSIVKMDSSDLAVELKKIIREDVQNEDYMSNGEMGGNTSKAYPWITSVKDGVKPVKFEGGENVLKLGVAKQPGASHLWISHLDSGPLDNNATWIANKLAGEAEAVRLAAAEEAARIAAAEEEARLAAAGEEEEEEGNEEEAVEEETPEEAAKRKAKNKKKNLKKKAKKMQQAAVV
jgi:hypothetical protein